MNINGPRKATLNVLAFDGASKRNKPDLAVGALVYARVESTDKDLEAELTCKAPEGSANKKDWVSGEAEYGELKGGGTTLRCSLGLSRSLMADDCPVLTALGSAVPFEIVS